MEDKRKIIKNKTHDKKMVEELDKQIREACQDKEWYKIVKVLGNLDNEGTDNTNVWKDIKKHFLKKNKSNSTGVKNYEGKAFCKAFFT